MAGLKSKACNPFETAKLWAGHMNYKSFYTDKFWCKGPVIRGNDIEYARFYNRGPSKVILVTSRELHGTYKFYLNTVKRYLPEGILVLEAHTVTDFRKAPEAHQVNLNHFETQLAAATSWLAEEAVKSQLQAYKIFFKL